MEYLDGIVAAGAGRSVTGRSPTARVIHILQQVCGSLHEAHSLGLVHRDIKPANIMLNRRGGVNDYVKVLDFGLVKAVDSRQNPALTAHDSITGTPLYMSPESIEMPIGRRPQRSVFARRRRLLPAHGSPGVRRGERAGDHSPPPRHTTGAPIGAIGRKVSPELERLILVCLAKSPDNRPQSATAVAEALSQCIPAQPWTAARARAWSAQFEQDPSVNPTLAATQALDMSTTVGRGPTQSAP